jgi:hypothetical protein
VNVEKLRAAFLWLKARNSFYVNIKWDESVAQQWSEEDVAVGITREEDLVSDQLLAVNQEVFERWMQEAEAQQDSAERGFSMGHRLLKLLAQQQEDTATECHWSLLRTLAADLQGQRCIRAASSLPENMIAALTHVHGVVELPVPPDISISSVTHFLAGMPPTEWSDELLVLYSELHTVRGLVSADEPTVLLGGVSAAPPGEDVGQREDILEAMAAAVVDVKHQAERCEDVMAEAEGDGAAVPDFVSAQGHLKRPRFPRVDPPPVEDEPGKAIREDTPGYIAQAFPKLFPHGAGDFHCLRCGMPKLLKFEEWGRFVLLWHDGRFIRHPRFRYWLLDTSQHHDAIFAG